MRVLITGITGFVGSHLADYILQNWPDSEIFGTFRVRSRTENIDHIRDRVQLLECDLKDPVSVSNVMQQARPERIFHLAAETFVPTSWKAPSQTIMVNILGQLNLMESMRESFPEALMQVACSSEEYGMVEPSELPIREDNPLRPLSPYAVSKVTQDLLAYQYHMSYKLHLVRTRAFNHTGPRRGEVFVESSFARQIAMIELGLQEPVIQVGNLQARRDFTDVRDMVRGYCMALDRCEPGEVYNVCSGRSISIQEVLDRLLALSRVRAEVRQDPARMRPSDVEVLQGDYSRFHKATGWRPEIPLETTLRDLLDYWRARLSSRSSAAAAT